MPGAQPSRAVIHRAASSVTRKAWVPPGVPGVHRVRRAPTPPEQVTWLTSEAVTNVAAVAVVFKNVNDSATYNYGTFPTNLSTDNEFPTRYDAVTASMEWTTCAVVLDANNLTMPSTAPAPPPGYVVEYEDDGQLVSALIRGHVSNTRLSGSLSPVVGIWEIPTATLVPGQVPSDASAINGPSHDPVGGAQVFEVTTFDTVGPGHPDFVVHEFETPPQTFPAGNQRVGWKIGHTPSVFETLIADGEDYQTRVYGVRTNPADPTSALTYQLEVEYVYRPSRYRFVPEPPPAAGWTTEVDSYIWDAGLYLPSDFDSLIGQPADPIPTGARYLSFLVVPGDVDVAAGDAWTQPNALAETSNGGAHYLTRSPSGANTPDPGSHLWVMWYGPSFDTNYDPVPPMTPDTLVPASLAENGTA